MSRLTILCFLGITLIFFSGCDPDTPPEEMPIIYPQIYNLTDYSHENPEYYLIEEEGFSATVPSLEFASYMEDDLIGFELPEVSSYFFIHQVKLTSDSTCDITIYDFVEDETQVTTDLNYEIDGNELIVSDAQQASVVPFGYDAAQNSITFCEIVFTNTYWDSFSGQTDYAGFDIEPCMNLDAADPIADFIQQNSNIEPNDTLAVLHVTRHFAAE